MRRHFHEELNELKDDILRMGLLVEGNVKKATEALLERDVKKAGEVAREEEKINSLEIEIDDKGHGLLGLEQPVAVDLRRITMILKINTDLERIGDHAVNIAKRVRKMMGHAPLGDRIPIRGMGEASLRMLRKALDAFTKEDADLAREVLNSDDVVDQYDDEVYRGVEELMKKDPEAVRIGIDIAMISYNLERIADLANNIAEDVIYIKQAKEVRHHIEKAS